MKKIYKKFLFIMLLPFLSMSTLAMEEFDDGNYKISCDTKKRGTKFLEARYRGESLEFEDKVRPEQESNVPRQIWAIRRVNDYYEISNITGDGGTRYLDASDGFARPLQQKPGDLEQKWFLRPVENRKGCYRIFCSVQNNMRCLEAFPSGDSSVRTKQEDVDKLDQIWRLVKLGNNNNNNNNMEDDD